MTHKNNEKTKRNALRYHIAPRQITYSKNGEAGEATLLNISTTGFLVELATVPVVVGDSLVIELEGFTEYAGEAIPTLAARVVRVNFDVFAAEFIDIDTKTSRDLIRKLAQQARKSGRLQASNLARILAL